MDAPKEITLWDITHKYPKGTRILDIGFGNAEFLKALCPYDYKLCGTEISPSCVENAYRILGNKVKLMCGELLPETDVVCCFEVVEHVEDPSKFLKGLPGKALYLSTPNPHRWLPEITKKLIGKAIYEKWDYPPNHLHRFEQSQLVDMLHEAGYKKVKVYNTKVQHHNILSSIVRRKNTENYDDMRPKHPHITGNIRKLLTPATIALSIVFNLLKLKGVSYMVKAERDL